MIFKKQVVKIKKKTISAHDRNATSYKFTTLRSALKVTKKNLYYEDIFQVFFNITVMKLNGVLVKPMGNNCFTTNMINMVNFITNS